MVDRQQRHTDDAVTAPLMAGVRSNARHQARGYRVACMPLLAVHHFVVFVLNSNALISGSASYCLRYRSDIFHPVPVFPFGKRVRRRVIGSMNPRIMSPASTTTAKYGTQPKALQAVSAFSKLSFGMLTYSSSAPSGLLRLLTEIPMTSWVWGFRAIMSIPARLEPARLG